jgi:hypothetical protein
LIVMKLAMAGLLGMATVSALAQAPSMGTTAGVQAGLLNGDRDSLSRSNKASNIVPADTSGADAPTLPSPTLGLDAPSRDYLLAARASLAAGHTGEAQQSLEMAETRALGGSISPDQVNLPRGSAIVAEIRNALHALGNGDRAKAIQIIDIALGS